MFVLTMSLWYLKTLSTAVQGECRTELARAMLSRSPQCTRTSIASTKLHKIWAASKKTAQIKNKKRLYTYNNLIASELHRCMHTGTVPVCMIVSTLVLQQLALDSLRLRTRTNNLFFHNLLFFVK